MTDDNADLGDDQLREELAAETEGADDSEKTVEEETADTGTTEDQGGEGEEAGDEEDEGKGTPFEDTDTPEIPTRNAANIIARQKKTIERLRSKSDTEEEGSSDDDMEDEDTADDEDATSVSREVARQLAPITEKLISDADEADLQTLFTNDPESKGYERAIRATMKREAFRQVPPAMIYAYLSREHVLAQGAKQRQVADTEAAHTRGTGSSRRTVKTKPSGNFPSAQEIDDMTDEEIEDLAQKVETGQSL
jgi:hypothetical protein